MSRRRLLSRDAEKIYNAFNEVVQYWNIQEDYDVQRVFDSLTKLKASAIIAETAGVSANYSNPFDLDEESLKEFREGIEFNEEA